MRSKQTLDKLTELIWHETNDTIYLALDAAATPSLPRALWFENKGKIKFAPLLDCRRDDMMREVSPYLVQLKPSDDLCKYLTSTCLKLPLGVFLVNSKPWAEVLDEAQSWLWPKKQNGDRVFFRYYDPRVFISLARYFLNFDKPHILGSFAQCFWYDLYEESSFTFSVSPESRAFNSDAPWSMEPDLEEWLLDSQTPHRIMDMLKRVDPDLCASHQTSELYQHIKSHIREAKEYKILELRDILSFSHISFLFPGFTENPTIQNSLIAYGRNKGPKKFNDLVSSWPPSLFYIA